MGIPMIVLDPKEQFLQLEETARAFGTAANHPSVQTSITYALSQYAIEFKPSHEQLQGVQDFVRVWLNMFEKAKELPTFPKKQLQPETLRPPENRT